MHWGHEGLQYCQTPQYRHSRDWQKTVLYSKTDGNGNFMYNPENTYIGLENEWWYWGDSGVLRSEG